MMKRFVLLVSVGMVLVLAALPAFAATISGTDKGNLLIGTPKADHIRGLAGQDKIFGKGGPDVIRGNAGKDYLNGGSGDDTLYGGTNGGGPREGDEFACGRGHDTIYVDKSEHSGHNYGRKCENIITQ